jgi:hypothetical protein
MHKRWQQAAKKMKLLIGAIIVLIFATCSQKNDQTVLLTGNLYFGFMRFGSYYNLSDSTINLYDRYIDTLKGTSQDKSTDKLLSLVKIVKANNLTFKPFVDILVQKDSVVKLYLDSVDYDQIKIYKKRRLVDENKVVSIVAQSKNLGHGLYNCVKLKSVILSDGETLPRPGKFKIEDYN